VPYRSVFKEGLFAGQWSPASRAWLASNRVSVMCGSGFARRSP
jgi:hypothetical protein